MLLHGWLQSIDSWRYTATEINKRFGWHVLMIDFYGHGETDWEIRDLEYVDVLK